MESLPISYYLTLESEVANWESCPVGMVTATSEFGFSIVAQSLTQSRITPLVVSTNIACTALWFQVCYYRPGNSYSK